MLIRANLIRNLPWRGAFCRAKLQPRSTGASATSTTASVGRLWSVCGTGEGEKNRSLSPTSLRPCPRPRRPFAFAQIPVHTFTRSLSLSSPLPASFQRLFISPTPISLPGKYLQELATIDDYLVNSLLCGEGSQDFPRVCLPYLYLSGRGGREEPKIPCLFLIRPLHSNFVYRWPPWILGAQSFVKRTVKKLNVCNCIFLSFLISVWKSLKIVPPPFTIYLLSRFVGYQARIGIIYLSLSILIVGSRKGYAWIGESGCKYVRRIPFFFSS